MCVCGGGGGGGGGGGAGRMTSPSTRVVCSETFQDTSISHHFYIIHTGLH